MGNGGRPPGRLGQWARNAGTVLAAVWIAGSALFFLVRFTLIFYRTHQYAIEKVLDRVSL